jgi:2,3-dihydroxyphenylpropionate 1,2-dioxygenase
MSHFPGTDRYASPDFDFDRHVLALLRDGKGRELAEIGAAELDRTGNVELRTWLTVLAAVGDVAAEVHCYEPSWHHGNAVVEWPCEAQPQASRAIQTTQWSPDASR